MKLSQPPLTPFSVSLVIGLNAGEPQKSAGVGNVMKGRNHQEKEILRVLRQEKDLESTRFRIRRVFPQSDGRRWDLFAMIEGHYPC